MEKVFAGRYQLGRRLGAGAMGAVYEAVDLPTHRTRALKVMHAHMLEREDLRARFALEARITARVRSPFIVDVVDAGVDDEGTPYIAMELLRGEDMSRRLRRSGRFSAAEAVLYLAHVAAALDETHRAGIVHRDLKPANLFLEDRGAEGSRVKVLDFGVAKVMAETLGQGTGVAGTPVYMAPEQLRSGRVGPATDVFALGMLAFTFLTGSAYWDEEQTAGGDMIAFALVAVEGPREPATVRAARLGATLPAAFDGWFAQATAPDPRDRFSRASTAVRRLAEVLGETVSIPPTTGDAAGLDDTLQQEEAALSDRDPTSAAGVSPEAPTLTAAPPLPGASGAGASAHGRTFSTGATATATAASKVAASGAERPPPSRAGPAPDEPASLVQGAPTGNTPGIRAPASPRPRPGRRLGLAVAVAAATLGLGFALQGPLGELFTPAPAPSPSSLPAPVAVTTSVLSCPPFVAVGAPEPSGWLGAAAASTFCERVRVLFGGGAARTLGPAELLTLPSSPSEALPEDPYSGQDVRERAIAAARDRASVFADGKVIRETSGFRVELRLRAPSGEEIGRGEGTGRALYEAVRAAMAPLVEAGALPTAAGLDQGVSDLTRAPDVAGALALHDLSFALAQNAGSVSEECARVDARAADLPELGPGERFRCAYTLGLPAPRVELPPSNPGPLASPGALAARARVRLMAHKDSDPALAAELTRLLAAETTPLGRSTLAATASCLLQAGSPERARELALLAIQAEPRNTAGEWCAPWIQAAVVTQGTASAAAVLRALRAWAPWDGYGWLYGALLPGDPAWALAQARRAYVLSPLDTYVADVLGDKLLASGAREEARSVATAIAAGGFPVHRVESDLLLLRVEASQARFGAALSRAKRGMVPTEEDAGWVRVQRLEIAWRALQIALLLGRQQEIADLAAKSLIDPEPSLLDGASVDVSLRILAICARTSKVVARRCFERFAVLRERLSLGALPETVPFERGAERYSAGDLPGAAAAWRSLVRDPGPYASVLGDAMIAAFEHTGARELVERLEAAVPDASDGLNGASLGTVRAARRAAKRGDRKKAAELAERVVRAWSLADETVPVVTEMRTLIGR